MSRLTHNAARVTGATIQIFLLTSTTDQGHSLTIADKESTVHKKYNQRT